MAAMGNSASLALSSCRQTMSGLVFRSPLSRFGRRRLMLLILNVAIFMRSFYTTGGVAYRRRARAAAVLAARPSTDVMTDQSARAKLCAPASGSPAARVRPAPVQQGRGRDETLAVTPARGGGKPRGRCAQQGRRPGHKAEQDRASARAIDVGLGVAGNFRHPALGIGRRETGRGGDEADQIGAIVGRHAGMAGGGQQDAPGFGADVAQVGCWPYATGQTGEV